MLSSSMICGKGKKLGWSDKEEEETARGNTQYALCPMMHADSRMENGKNQQRQNINNTPVVAWDVKNVTAPIVLVLLGTGCASPVIWIMLWMKLRQGECTYLIQCIAFFNFLAMFDVL